MLAYLFWHQPRDGVDASAYEDDLRSFHAALEGTSASFRLAQLPFGKESGYEDWYLVDNWDELGELNKKAVDSGHRSSHDRVAMGTAGGWGGIYELLRGEAEVPQGTVWLDKPYEEPARAFVSSLHYSGIWRRQLVLGPGPEFCCAVDASHTRTRI